MGIYKFSNSFFLYQLDGSMDDLKIKYLNEKNTEYAEITNILKSCTNIVENKGYGDLDLKESFPDVNANLLLDFAHQIASGMVLNDHFINSSN